MSWQAHVDALLQRAPNVIEAAVIWGTVSPQIWSTPTDLLPITDQDIKVLAGDTSKFAMAGPRLMGTKFFMVSDKLKDPMVKCMSLKATGADKPYYLVFGLIPDGILIAKVISNDVKPAISPFFAALGYLQG